jgi:O-antigen/teichoic acid export membrane protein
LDIKSKINILTRSKLVKDSAGYTILNFLEKALPFLVFPILTRKLSIEDVGLFVLYQTIVEILMPIMTLNIDNAILINFYKLELVKFKKYFSTGLILFGYVFLFTLFIIIVFRNYISELIQFPSFWIMVVGITVFFRFLVQNRQNLWRVNFEIKKYSKLTLGISVVNNFVGLFLVIYSNFGWTGMIVGHLIGYSLFGSYSLFTFIKGKILIWNKDVLFMKDILKVSLPIAIHRFGIWLGSAGNKIIIATLLGTAATGSYGVGAVFAAVIAILEDALSKAVIPHIYEKLKKNTAEEKKLVVKMSYAIYIFLFGVSIMVYFIGYYLIDFIFGKQLNDTKSLLLPLIIAALFKGLYKLHVHYIFFTKKTIQVTKITFTTGVLNILMSYLFILNFGLIGAAYSLVIINFLQYILSFRVGNNLMPMPWFKS